MQHSVHDKYFVSCDPFSQLKISRVHFFRYHFFRVFSNLKSHLKNQERMNFCITSCMHSQGWNYHYLFLNQHYSKVSKINTSTTFTSSSVIRSSYYTWIMYDERGAGALISCIYTIYYLQIKGNQVRELLVINYDHGKLGTGFSSKQILCFMFLSYI